MRFRIKTGFILIRHLNSLLFFSSLFHRLFPFSVPLDPLFFSQILTLRYDTYGSGSTDIPLFQRNDNENYEVRKDFDQYFWEPYYHSFHSNYKQPLLQPHPNDHTVKLSRGLAWSSDRIEWRPPELWVKFLPLPLRRPVSSRRVASL